MISKEAFTSLILGSKIATRTRMNEKAAEVLKRKAREIPSK